MISRAVLVTGSSRGLGAAIARRFAESGDRVAVHHRDSQKEAEAVLAYLPGKDHILINGDLADPHAVREMVDLAAQQLDGLDVLVNNAGIFGGRDRPHPVFGMDYTEWRETWRRTLDVNLFGAANAIWAAAQHMKGRGGRIINVSSRGAFRGEPEQPAYGASKAAMNAMGQSLAIALAPYGITVAGVAPGFIETDMVREHLEGPAGDAIRAQSPFGRIARPEEVAAAVHWLASAEAEWATGAILDLNGASYLRT
jgi:NAD(P)-dependent dehydrogenase (short-subunit alcohol dehydrogenase family)